MYTLDKIEDPEIISMFIELYDELENIIIPINRHREHNAGIGRTAPAGLVYNWITKQVMYGKLNKYEKAYDLMWNIGKKLGLEFTTIQVNKDYISKPHRDSKNAGRQHLVSFGNYKDGYLYIENDSGTIDKIDAYLSLLNFEGSKYLHYNDKHIGTKYSLIFYNCKNVLRVMNSHLE